MKKKICKSERVAACGLGVFFLIGVALAYFLEIAGQDYVAENSRMFFTSSLLLSTYFFLVAITGRRFWL